MYIHVPFCAKRCHYCDFYSTTRFENAGDHYLTTLVSDISNKSDHGFFKDYALDTVYFGGGTPNMYQPDQVDSLLKYVQEKIGLESVREITLEVNPEFSRSLEQFTHWKSAGINRLSIGMQSCLDHELDFLGRIHNHQTTLECFRAARDAGFYEIGLDLIYGVPGQTASDLEKSLKELVRLNPEHISAYNLTREGGTVYDEWILAGKITQNDEEIEEAFFRQVHDCLTSAGYEHYEISNYAKPGHRAIHNDHYWNGTDYLGLGPSAHSKMNNRRFWYSPDLTAYLIRAQTGNFSPDGIETIDSTMHLSEQVLLGLRTASGLDLSHLLPFERQSIEKNARLLNENADSPYFGFNDSRLFCTLNGWLVLDYLQGELLQN